MSALASGVQRAVERQTFALRERVLAVEFGDETAAQVLSATYDALRVQCARPANHVASMRRLGDGRLYVRFDRQTLSPGDLSQSPGPLSAYYAAKEVFARFAAAAPSCVAFYGALVCVDGSAVLILGPTGIGKTVLALHMAGLGARLLGDETAILDLRAVEACALARRPSLRESALPFLPEQIRASVDAAEHVLETARGRFWFGLRPHDLGGITTSAQPYRLRAVCIVRERAQTFSMRRIELAQALPALMQRAYARPSQLAEVAALRHAMRSVRQYEIQLGQPEASAAALLAGIRACE